MILKPALISRAAASSTLIRSKPLILAAQRSSATAQLPSKHCTSTARFSTSTAKSASNQVFDPVRSTERFHTYLSLAVASRQPLITFWTASWCSTCRQVSPLIRSLVEAGVGADREGLSGVAFAPVEFDSPDAGSLAMTYMITAVPTLLAFDDRGEPAPRDTGRLMDGRRLADREFVAEWIREQARRYGGGGGGSGGDGNSGSVFGGLFGR